MTRQVVVVDGLRTPFQKMGTGFSELSSIDLGAAVVSELLQRTGVSGRQVDRVVYGSVAPNLSGPNIAREVVLDAGLPRNIDAFSVVRACATSYQTAISASQAIAIGEIDCAIAGGADSASDVPISVSKKLAKALIKLNKARTLTQRIKAFSKLSPRDLLPQPPALVERSTGLSMGQSAEQMAQANNISRAAQDEFAHRSHQLAAAAWADGRYSQEVATVFISPTYTGAISVDNMVRGDSNLEAYAKLRPVFDKKHGTITAANSSPLSDGASALLMMNAAKAKADGHTPLATIKSYASTALDPREQMLMGPAYAIPLALERANLKLEDIDLLDIHEAFGCPNPLGHPSAPIQDVCEREARSLSPDRKDRLGQIQRHGRLAFGRPPIRGNWRSANRADSTRAQTSRRWVGAVRGLCGRRPRRLRSSSRFNHDPISQIETRVFRRINGDVFNRCRWSCADHP